MSPELKSLPNAVVFSLPGSEDFYLGYQNNNGLSSEPQFGSPIFVVKPFKKTAPPAFLRMEVCVPFVPEKHALNLREISKNHELKREEYIRQVSRAINTCQSSGGKIVLSKASIVPMKDLDAMQSLIQLRKIYPNTMVYLLISQEFGTWMGATPETLVSRDGELFQTMALAGTRWGEELFSQKEFDEQMLVAKDIMEKLADEIIEVSDVYERQFGDLRHLCTDFKWQSVGNDALYFAEKLHPTPAICGAPTDIAMKFINEHEVHDRSLYTGYLGVIGFNENDHLFVNLRCMQLHSDAITVYTGGGINQKSDPVSEWEEVERKKNAVLNALVYG